MIGEKWRGLGVGVGCWGWRAGWGKGQVVRIRIVKRGVVVEVEE